MPPQHLLLTHSAFIEIMRRLQADPARVLRAGVGFNHLSDRTEWLIHRLTQTHNSESPGGIYLAVAGYSSPSVLESRLRLAVDSATRPSGVLLVGLDDAFGEMFGWQMNGDSAIAFDCIRLMAPGLPEWRPNLSASPPPSGPDYWSRTSGALGEATLVRLRRLEIAVVGCGRLGSVVAQSLVRLPIGGLTLIDADVLEPHNLGEMAGVRPQQLGQSKVEAVAANARRDALHPTLRIRTVDTSVLSMAALAALKEADLLISVPDSPAARLYVGCVAALYARPLLDIGTAVLSGDTGPEMGADVRLVVDGCLQCWGGVADPTNAQQSLRTGRVSIPTADDPEAWRRQRAGSLASLNGLAWHLGWRLVEGYLTGRVRETAWLHLNEDAGGVPRWDRPERSAGRCPLCRRIALGDSGLAQMSEILSLL